MAQKFVYKNTSEHDLVVVGFGLVKAGATFESEERVHNPNLVLEEGKRYTGTDPVTQVKKNKK